MSRIDPLTAFFVLSGVASILALALTVIPIFRQRRAGAFPRGVGLERWAPDGPQFGLVLIVAIVLTGSLTWYRGGTGCQTLTIASSQEKFTMFGQLADIYNHSGRFFGGWVDPLCARVNVEQVNSGDAEAMLETGWTDKQTYPDVWTPASSAWVQLLLARAPAQATLIPSDYVRKSLFTSPLVIAMPAPMATALGYPAIGWSDIFALATDPAGWGAKGHPAWGPFRLGKTNPHVSTSGLHALIGTYYAIHADRSPATVNAAATQALAAGIERSVIHYGETASDFLRNLQDVDSHSAADPDHLAVLQYVSAIAVEEKEVVDYNLGKVGTAQFAPPFVKLLPVYPNEGTLTADHPYISLTSSDKQAAAQDFYEFLREPPQQAFADQNGFRQDNGEPGPWLRAQGVSVLRPNQVRPPAGNVLSAEINAWDALRKPARVMILIDRGAPSAALDTAISDLQNALKGFKPQDSIMVATYPAKPESSEDYLVLQPMTPADRAHLPLLQQQLSVATIVSGKASPLIVDAALESAADWMRTSYDPSAINAILLVEPAPGTGSATGDAQLLHDLRAQPISQFVHVFAVGPKKSSCQLPGSDPAVCWLERIALAGEGASYAPDAASHFLTDAISNF